MDGAIDTRGGGVAAASWSRRGQWAIRAALVAGMLAAWLMLGGSSAALAASPPTPTDLQERGWTCRDLPWLPVIPCFNPGTGAPVPGGAPAYAVRVYDRSGAFLNTSHMIRGDLYRGQPCGTGTYRHLALIGYYECVHP